MIEPQQARDTGPIALPEGGSRRLANELFHPFCRLPFSPMHMESFARWDRLFANELPTRTGTRLAIAAPRGNAKSTIHSLILPLLDIALQRERYIVLISATEAQACGKLRNMGGQLRSNSELRKRLPRESLAGMRLTRKFIEVGDARIDAFGAGCEIRGITHHEWRPTKIILDDVENSDAVRSDSRRIRLRKWFDEVVQNLGDGYTHIEIVGTVLHTRSLLAELLQRPDFEARLYASVIRWSEAKELWDRWEQILMSRDDPERAAHAAAFLTGNEREMLREVQVLWPDKEDYIRLMTIKATVGRTAFFKEKMNDPQSDDTSKFQVSEWPRFDFVKDDLVFDAPHELMNLSRRQMQVFGFLDPATGRQGPKADYSAIVVIGWHEGKCYVLDVHLGRSSLKEQAQAAWRLHMRWKMLAFGYEENMFQRTLEDFIAQWPTIGRPRVVPVKHNTAKVARIGELEPLAAYGGIAVYKHLPEEFWIEAEGFPHVAHDDVLDALAAAVKLATAPGCATILSMTSKLVSPSLPRFG